MNWKYQVKFHENFLLKPILVVRVFSTRILAKFWKSLYIFTWLTETLILVTLPFRKIRKNLEKSVKSFCLVDGVIGGFKIKYSGPNSLVQSLMKVVIE